MNAPSATKIIAETEHLRLVDRNGWESVERRSASGVVALVAVTHDGKLLLVEQWRPPVGKFVIELPAGLVGDETDREAEPPQEAAERELLEETGYAAERLEELGRFATSAGLTDETVTFFAARNAQRTGPGGGVGSEELTVHEIQLDEVDRWLLDASREDRIVDARVFTGLYLFGISAE